MKKKRETLKNILITVFVLALSFVLSLLFQNLFNVQEHITTLFVFAVFLISLLTDGYVYGISSAVAGVLAVNYAFTFPYFSLNFTITVNLISAVVMVVIAVLTSTLTIKVKHHEAARAEGEQERLRANLLRAISHDLRTPLTTIYGSTCTLIENREKINDAQKVTILEGMKEDSEWLVHMVENLLSITKINSGDVKIIKKPTVLEELVDSVIIKFRKRYPETTVKIEIPEEIVIIPMDAMLIEQVLMNILENAVQHAKGMTEILFRSYTIGGKAVFEIADNGCGIAPEKLKTMFKAPYPPCGQSADGQRHSIGIGLSVCSTIIKAHGGEICVQNTGTGGAMFRITLLTDSEEVKQ